MIGKASPMSISTWDEIRTAHHVARLGTVSGAAEALGVHHATVIRHVDALEERLGVKLFQRHARGYTATEAGQDLLQVANATDERILRLEYGEAHVAIRAGTAPEEPDNVVQPFVDQRLSLYAAPRYISRRGRPASEVDLEHHDFVGLDGPSRAPFELWLREHIPPERIVFRVSDAGRVRDAIEAGAGIGFVSCWEAERTEGLVRLFETRPEWSAPSWIVTHVDLHRTTKVQTFLKFLKEEAKKW